MNTTPYLGSKISLISKSENRYEGILYTIDTKTSIVALAKVRVFGTEGRQTDRPVAPRDEIYEYIIFRASDIKDLQVCEPAKPSVLSSGLSSDPAIVHHSGPVSTTYPVPYGQPPIGNVYSLPVQQQYSNQMSFQQIPLPIFPQAETHSGASSQTSLGNKSPTIDASVQVSSGGIEKEDSRNKYENRRPRDGEQGSNEQRGSMQSRNMQQNRGGRRGGRGRGRGYFMRNVETLKFDSEYDFEQANEEFKQLEEKLASIKLDKSDDDALAKGDNETDPAAYDREKSFFDNISCEASRIAKGIPRFDWRVERKLNVETFGVASSNRWMRRRRGRGGFRRGYSRTPVTQSSIDVTKTVTFGPNEVLNEDASLETPAEVQREQIPIIEIVEDKDKDWKDDSKEEWNIGQDSAVTV